jgi:hypothetical protein
MPSAALARHPATPCSALRGIEVSITRRKQILKISYALKGDIARLRIPPPRAPRVAERLWQHTCCEIFIAREGAPGYREFNLSPSGEWAAYAFDDYRQGAREVEPIDPGIRVEREPRRLELVASVPVAENGKLRIGLSAVVEEDGGQLSYWALRHAPGKPDFHHADAFALELDEVRH